MDCYFNNTMIKVVKNSSSLFGSIWLTRPLTIHNTVHWSGRHTQSFRCPLIFLSNETIGFFVAFSLLKKATFLPILQTNAKYNNNLWEKCLSSSSKVHVVERKTLQVRYLTYGWLFYKVHLLPPEKWQQNRTKI